MTIGFDILTGEKISFTHDRQYKGKMLSLFQMITVSLISKQQDFRLIGIVLLKSLLQNFIKEILSILSLLL